MASESGRVGDDNKMMRGSTTFTRNDVPGAADADDEAAAAVVFAVAVEVDVDGACGMVSMLIACGARVARMDAAVAGRPRRTLFTVLPAIAAFGLESVLSGSSSSPDDTNATSAKSGSNEKISFGLSTVTTTSAWHSGGGDTV